MAVYFDHTIQAPGPNSKALVHNDVEWHENFAVLAVASKNESTDSDGCVNFYLEEVSLVLCCVAAKFEKLGENHSGFTLLALPIRLPWYIHNFTALSTFIFSIPPGRASGGGVNPPFCCG